MDSTTPTRTQNERADLTRARILDAAIREFSEKGLAGARTEQIAEAAGVNKALLYYYFRGKEDLYAAALDSVVEAVRASSFAVLDADATPGERFLQLVLNHFDRMYSNLPFQSLMQQEMIRMHRGEENALAPLAEKLMKPLWLRVQTLVEEGIASGEFIEVDWMHLLFAGLGANVFYFLSAPMTRLAMGFDPLEPSTLALRREVAVRFLGQAVFVDRRHGVSLAEHVLIATPMPEARATANNNIGAIEPTKDQVRQK